MHSSVHLGILFRLNSELFMNGDKCHLFLTSSHLEYYLKCFTCLVKKCCLLRHSPAKWKRW